MTDLPLKDSKYPKVQLAEHSIKPKSHVVAEVNTGNINQDEQKIRHDTVTVSKQRPAEKAVPVKKDKKKINSWIGRQFQVRVLKGHADVITCIVVDQDILVTGRYEFEPNL